MTAPSLRGKPRGGPVGPFRRAAERVIAPSYSTCGHCRRPWRFVDSHSTPYTPSRGCFPLCEVCWQQLGTPEARLPYYEELIAIWKRPEPTGPRSSRPWRQACEHGYEPGVVTMAKSLAFNVVVLGSFTLAVLIAPSILDTMGTFVRVTLGVGVGLMLIGAAGFLLRPSRALDDKP